MFQILKRKRFFVHVLLWVLWLSFHIATDLIYEGEESGLESILFTILTVAGVQVPLTYLTYYAGFWLFDKHKSRLLLILTIALISALYVVVDFLFQKYVVTSLGIYPEQRGIAPSRNFAIMSINRYFLYFMPFALLYWYSSSLARSELKRQTLVVEKVQSENEKLQSDYNFLKMQINPHFIFNCLQSVDNYVLKNDTVKASHYLNRFSTLMRRTLEYSPEAEIKLSDEIANMELYLQLEQMRASNAFAYVIDATAVPDPDFVKIPSMVIQPFVENAVQHGMNPGEKSNRIRLVFTETENALQCVIEDNGPGIKQTKAARQTQVSTHKSMGSSITYQRIETYNSLHRGGITVKTEDLRESGTGLSGTRITLLFQFK